MNAARFLAARLPREAALRIDKLWDACLDELPDFVPAMGHEVDEIRDHMQS